ncbi:LysR family transcriptional regulator [Streptosporangium lutulentum]|uniref:DNA-binding transcriptional LysR family regulator n=1 Tax=Streptosporangium lutulentum TaxID=1461250 RepID=A0ABT9Q4G7_9ACTN|nr:LysR family transcriptional regulator [Streptosporangium lutulentum]MDP9841622.1 DNA-binding transcriptional LysR family regulator [Streptosporangium lutulentum]
MEQPDARTFLTLAEELHFGRTAERLHTSTAQVSKAVKKLERQVGAPLFQRSSRKVTLTPIGERLRDDILPGYELIQTGFARAIAAGRSVGGTLGVGFIGAAAGMFMMEVAKEFQDRYPDCEVRIKESLYGDGVELLRREEVDVLFVGLPVIEADLTVGPVLTREKPVLAVSARHPFAGRDAISFQDLARTTLLSAPVTLPDYYDASLVPQQTDDGRPIVRGPAFATTEEMLALVGAGKGTYPVPVQAARFYARPDVAYVPIHDARPFEWALVWRSTGETACVRAFNQAAQTLTVLP